METSKILKIFAIVIVIVMAFSMIAVGYLWLENSPAQNNNAGNGTDNLPTPSATAFTYTVSFDANALRDVGTLKIGAYTSVLDKSAIDSSILKVDGVSKVLSQFTKTSQDSNAWVYLADVTLKKNGDALLAANSILDLNYFDQSRKSDFLAAKYITVSAPPWVMLHNSDLNIDRNFSFPSPTLSAISSLTTSAGDLLVVGGQLKLQGSSILSLSLTEQQNLTQAPRVIDTNSFTVDTNAPVVDANAPADANAP